MYCTSRSIESQTWSSVLIRTTFGGESGGGGSSSARAGEKMPLNSMPSTATISSAEIEDDLDLITRTP